MRGGGIFLNQFVHVVCVCVVVCFSFFLFVVSFFVWGDVCDGVFFFCFF